MKHLLSSKWVIILPLIVALVIYGLLNLTKAELAQLDIEEIKRPVSTIVLKAITIRPKVSSYGYVRPSRVWEGIAEVAGEVVFRHPNLERGDLISKGELILQIDKTDYKLNLAQARATLKVIREQLNEVTVRQANTESSLNIEQESLDLSNQELARLEELFKTGAVGKSTLDSQKIQTLNQRQRTQELQNQLNLQIVEQSLLEARLEQAESEMAQAEENLARTDIIAPYDARVADVYVDIAQYVSQGAQLFVADDIAAAEIEMQVLPSHLEQIVRTSKTSQPFPVLPSSFKLLKKVFNLEGQVSVLRNQRKITWPADFQRISDRFDERTRTIGIILEVKNPYSNIIPGQRPPLIKGSFVEASLYSKAIDNQLVIPTIALREKNTVYVVRDERLRIQDVQLGIRQSGYVTIDKGLQEGDQVIVSPMPYVVDKMAVQSFPDENLQQQLSQMVQS